MIGGSPIRRRRRDSHPCADFTDLRTYDFFGRISDQVSVRSGPNRSIFLVMSFILAIGFVGEVLFDYQSIPQSDHFSVDPKFGDAYQFALNVSFPNLPCNELQVDSLDVTGEARSNLMSGFTRIHLKDGLPYVPTTECQPCYEATTETNSCCNSCKALRGAYRAANMSLDGLTEKDQCHNVGCRVEGSAPIQKVAGDMRIAVGRMVHYQGRVYQDIDAKDLQEFGFNASHIIHDIRFGHNGQESLQMPLSGVAHTQMHKYVTYVYDIHFVPTEYDGQGGTHQYAFSQMVVNETRMADDGVPINVPGFYIDYEFSPLMLDVRTRQADYGQLAVKAIIAAGGAFSLLSFVECLFSKLADGVLKPN